MNKTSSASADQQYPTIRWSRRDSNWGDLMWGWMDGTTVSFQRDPTYKMPDWTPPAPFKDGKFDLNDDEVVVFIGQENMVREAKSGGPAGAATAHSTAAAERTLDLAVSMPGTDALFTLMALYVSRSAASR